MGKTLTAAILSETNAKTYMQYTIEKVAALIGARIAGRSAQKHCVSWLLTDSRSLAFPETTLFFALRTRTGDGHRYIADLYRRGVRSFVVETVPDAAETRFPEAIFLLVCSPFKALQRLAERHREEYALPVVGITGSNGKTVVKEWLYRLLAPSFNVTRSPRSHNSQTGVPLSVWLLNDRSQVAVFEAGISLPGEMDALRAIIQPTIGIMTGIGPAHQENFATLADKCREKFSLFRDCETLVYEADSPIVAAAAENFRGRHMAWSRQDASAAVFVAHEEKDADGTHIIYIYAGVEHKLYIPFTDSASTTNCLHCLCAALTLGLSPETAAERMATLEYVAMRLEVKQGVRGCTLIADTYNNDLASLDIALDFMHRRSETSGRRVLVLSDILQSGMPASELYGAVAEMTAARGVDLLVGVGPDISAARSLFSATKHFFPSTESLVKSGLLDTFAGDLVLLKGSRPFGFERLTALLSRRVHETTLEIDLGALAENLNYYRSMLRPETKIVCMVKASAYGSGAVEVAKTLQDRGVDYLAVAVADEGVALREAGITQSIIVMNPEMSSFRTLFDYKLEPEVYSFGLLEALIRAAGSEGITNFPVHVKFDTGMSRLGFHPEHDVEALVSRLLRQSALIPRSVFSHFAGSDAADFDAFTREQFDRFDRASRRLQEAFPHKILRHICNSAGIERFPEYHLDMVRLGLGLYGIDPIDNRTLHNVAALRTTILQIRTCEPPATVGYSRRGTLDRPSRIAAIPIGYADGLNRHLGRRRGYCLVGGQRAEYVGNICMDVCMIDVTDIDCREGDAVEIFGENLPPAVLAGWLDTIPYEVLTSVSERVKRIYYQG